VLGFAFWYRRNRFVAALHLMGLAWFALVASLGLVAAVIVNVGFLFDHHREQATVVSLPGLGTRAPETTVRMPDGRTVVIDAVPDPSPKVGEVITVWADGSRSEVRLSVWGNAAWLAPLVLAPPFVALTVHDVRAWRRLRVATAPRE
jgi:hypothetical protein